MLSLKRFLKSLFKYRYKVPVLIGHKAVDDMCPYIISLRIAGPDAKSGLIIS